MAPRVPVLIHSVQATSHPETGRAANQMVHSSVLVIGDEAGELRGFTLLLSHLGFNVIASADAVEALHLLGGRRFDAVVCDWLASVPTGFDLFLERPGRQRGRPFVVVDAALVCLRERKHTEECGYIAKPVHLDELLASLMPDSSARAEAVRVHLRTPHLRHILKAIRMIEERFSELELRVGALAKADGLSAEHLCRIFTDYLGHTLLCHLHQLRVSAAEAQLAATDLPIYTIARNCGYHTTSELDRSFGRRHGETPTAYRCRVRTRLMADTMPLIR